MDVLKQNTANLIPATEEVHQLDNLGFLTTDPSVPLPINRALPKKTKKKKKNGRQQKQENFNNPFQFKPSKQKPRLIMEAYISESKLTQQQKSRGKSSSPGQQQQLMENTADRMR